ncbi:UNVERIFIED_CONTAM: hypothetical protein FKN15_070307 [Acipenser sinensis]
MAITSWMVQWKRNASKQRTRSQFAEVMGARVQDEMQVYEPGQEIIYQCNPGYRMTAGSRKNICKATGTWPSPTMKCSPVTCGLPEIPKYGLIKHHTKLTGNTTYFGDTVQYECSSPYVLFGNEFGSCSANGNWTETPECKLVTCPPPTDIKNGFMSFAILRKHGYGEKIRYGCDSNYVLDGSMEIQCEKTGHWSTKPVCRASCIISVKRARIFYNGKKIWIKDLTASRVQHAEMVAFYCKDKDRECGYPVLTQCVDGNLIIPSCYEVSMATTDASLLSAEEGNDDLLLDAHTHTTMSSQEQTWEKLDSEFDHYLVDMKPYVLKLPHKSERQRCALWIKKLCEPSGSDTGVMGRKNRNMYARLLLHMLRRGALEGPFTHRPEPGTLKTLPTYMSIYFDEPLSARPLDWSSERLPDWVMGELDSRDSKVDNSWRLTPREDGTLTSSPRPAHRSVSIPLRVVMTARPEGSIERQTWIIENPRYLRENPIPLSPISLKTSLGKNSTCYDDQTPVHMHEKEIENPRYFRENPIPLSPISLKTSLGKNSTCYDDQTPVHMHEKEVEMKAQVLEARCHEEKLKLQQKHDADVQKILDRKNNEIEELKNLYRTKQKESEEAVRKLEKKVQSLVRESQVIRESKENQITELKKMADQSADSLKNEWEKKLHSVVTEMEQEKFKLQKKHTENIQELLEDTNSRLSKMEAEYSAQTKATNQMVRELEARVQQLTVEAENSNLQRQKVTQEKAELEHHNTVISTELHEARIKYNALQREKGKLIEEHEQNIRQITASHDSDLVFFKQEHALSAAKEQDSRFQLEKSDIEHLNEKKLRSLQSGAQRDQAEAKKKMDILEEVVREKEEQLARLTELQKIQAQQAEGALEQFKRQVALNSEKVYSEMKQQPRHINHRTNKSDQMLFYALRSDQSCGFFRVVPARGVPSLRTEGFPSVASPAYWRGVRRPPLSGGGGEEEWGTVLITFSNRLACTRIFWLEACAVSRPLFFTLRTHHAATQELQHRKTTQLSGSLQASPQAPGQTTGVAGAREKEEQLARLTELQKIQAQQAEGALEQFKRQVALNSEKVYSEMKQQMEKVEADLSRSKSLREKQSEEFSWQHQELKQRYEQQIVELKLEHEQEKTHLFQQHNAEKDSLVQDHELEIGNLEKQLRAAMEHFLFSPYLQSTVSSLREEAGRQQLSAERHLQERLGKVQEEKRSLTREHDKTNKALQDKIENFQNQVRSVEKKLQNKELESQEQITHIRQECEQKIKGLMPAALRQELEDTITSLKSQVVQNIEFRFAVM